MKITIFGGAGFIGTNIAREAIKQGYQVIIFDNLLRKGVTENLEYLKKTYKDIAFIRGDVRNTQDFQKLPKSIDCIINLAANLSIPRSIIDPRYDCETNLLGHINVLEHSRTHGFIPVIFASTNKVYTDKINTHNITEAATRYVFENASLRNGLDESTDVNGFEGFTNSPYGVAKLAAEKYSREYWKNYGVPIVVNRMSCIYGEFQKGTEEQGWIDWFLRAKHNELPVTIFGNGKQVRDALFGRDIAKLYLNQTKHIMKYQGNTFNVGGGPNEGFNVSLLEFVDLIDEMFPGKKLQIRFAPRRLSDQTIFISNNEHVTNVTGWKPKTKLIDGLKTMWSDYDQN